MQTSQKSKKAKAIKESVEIDDIFNNKPKTKGKDLKKIQKPVQKVKESKGPRFTEEGFRIIKFEDMISKGGGDTPDCPFDCTCCY
jgi:hypothetical protein